ncbi:MAG: hypothetical protein J07HQW2_00575 [Haloquadratum walsbyi J07HQW2]|uniref:Uncharacterized protein n=1 Tax=Haloquadratum walsbyi J07HQW2 TaxID=1238425 RepID=U1PPB6_9EURY|nr:MAG: hypothetical protein J07HQW2_00575 [Haloquadratum walsbyi J07HQW2]
MQSRTTTHTAKTSEYLLDMGETSDSYDSATTSHRALHRRYKADAPTEVGGKPP